MPVGEKERAHHRGSRRRGRDASSSPWSGTTHRLIDNMVALHAAPCSCSARGPRMMEMTAVAIRQIHQRCLLVPTCTMSAPITVDEDLLDAANIVPGQKVDITSTSATANGCHLRLMA